MRKTVLLLAGLAFCAAAAPASAQYYYGPGYGRHYYDAPRYYDGPRYYDDGYRRRGGGSLSYWCSFGSQTPRSVQWACRDRGY